MTDLTSDQVDRLALDVHALDPTRRCAVGPYRSVLVVVLYLRHNLARHCWRSCSTAPSRPCPA